MTEMAYGGFIDRLGDWHAHTLEIVTELESAGLHELARAMAASADDALETLVAGRGPTSPARA